jgi:2,5-diketo-D-gluconate reductase B
MSALKQAQDNGLTRRIGVSNFTIDLLDRGRALLGPDALATNQIEIHPWLQVPRIRDYACSAGLTLTAYQPLLKGQVSSDPTLSRIAETHGVAAGAVALAFLMAEGHVVIPASASAGNLAVNFAASQLQLTEAEIAEIRTINRGYRNINPTKSPHWDD